MSNGPKRRQTAKKARRLREIPFPKAVSQAKSDSLTCCKKDFAAFLLVKAIVFGRYFSILALKPVTSMDCVDIW